MSTEINDVIANKQIKTRGKNSSRHKKTTSEKKQKNKSYNFSDSDYLYNNLNIKPQDGNSLKHKTSENSIEELDNLKSIFKQTLIFFFFSFSQKRTN